MASPDPHTPSTAPAPQPGLKLGAMALKTLLWLGGLALAGIISVVVAVGIALAVAFPNLPDISELSDYRPILPLRVFTADGVILG